MSIFSGDNQMKEFILLTEDLLAFYGAKPVDTMIVEEAPVIQDPIEGKIITECKDLIFKLRSLMEDDSSGEYALGVEMGMQRAADMIENLVKRFEKSDNGQEV